MKKRLWSSLLAVCLIVSLLPTTVLAEENEQGTQDSPWNISAEGADNNVTAYLTQNNSSDENPTYTLTISGNGAMQNYTENDGRPWNNMAGKVTRIVISEGVQTVGQRAFFSMTNVGEILLPDSIESIGEVAFSFCGISGETTLHLGKNLSSITAGAFRYTNISAFTVDAENSNFMARDGILYTKDGKELVSYPIGKQDTVFNNDWLKGVETIRAQAFYGKTFSTPSNVVIPNTVKTIGVQAFSNVWSEKSVKKKATLYLADSVETIGDNAFFNCDFGGSLRFGPNLTSVTSTSFTTVYLTAVDATEINEKITLNGQKFTTQGAIAYVKNDAQKSTVSKVINEPAHWAFTNGGTFAANTTFEAGKLAAPVKSGYKFVDWYTTSDFSDTPVTTAEAGKTYYAKWTKRQLSVIEVTSKNTTVPYGTVLGTDDFTVKAVYDNDESENVTEYTISPATLTTLGENSVTIAYGGKTATYTITVVKAPQTPPEAPTLKKRDYTSITLNEVAANAYGAKAEYSKDNGATWQDSPEFTGLTVGTTYTFAVRYAETGPYAASESSATAGFSTLRYSSPSNSSSASSYTVSVPNTKNGDVTVSPKSAKSGDTVTITVSPDKGYELDTIAVKDANGNTVTLTDNGNGKYTFTMPASKVTISAEFAEIQATSTFTDVPADAYYAEAVEWAVKNGITNGTSDTTFSPDKSCTRAEIVTFLWRAAGSPEPKGTSSFSDVSADSYYAKAVAWAVENGITDGTDDGKFSPDATCTREQAVTFLYRTSGSPAVSGGGAFSDVAADAYYASAVTWAEQNGVTGGIGDGVFGSGNDCTRAQIVTMLMRFYAEIVK